MNGLDNETLGPTRALAMRAEVTRCRNEYIAKPTPATEDAYTAALSRLHVASELARRREGDEEEPERWDGQS
jgi:hypothetical protein